VGKRWGEKGGSIKFLAPPVLFHLIEVFMKYCFRGEEFENMFSKYSTVSLQNTCWSYRVGEFMCMLGVWYKAKTMDRLVRGDLKAERRINAERCMIQ
jgi:hypothetical protein